MQVEVLLFGPEAAAAGASRVTVTLGGDRTCAGLRSRLAETCPSLQPLLPAARFAVNSEFASPGRVVEAGDEVALIGLVSGG